ncbi:MAG: hypothetical protein LBH06_05775, partial [Rikenellaceae bacterium]|nr:hypothetical protein [Rikenellaceae bacterium]
DVEARKTAQFTGLNRDAINNFASVSRSFERLKVRSRMGRLNSTRGVSALVGCAGYLAVEREAKHLCPEC